MTGSWSLGRSVPLQSVSGDGNQPGGADLTSQFSTQLRRLRLRAEMTQESLSERSGVSVRTIRGFETGERTDPRMSTVRMLADALELAPGERDDLLAAITGQALPDLVDQPRPVPRDALDDTAEQLAEAVRAHWQREEELRKIQDPFPLPVRWRPAAEHLTDHWENICRAPAGGVSGSLDLTGRLDEIAAVYQRIPSGRLLVLGRAGSGKTVLTLRFVLDSLKTRGPGDAVPVIFSLGSWNPATVTLRDWLTRQLTRDYPGLAAPGPGGSTLAAALVGTGRILPVLDGFDEIAAGLHRAAVNALNASPMPLILTSRPDEYAAVAATDVLTAAAGVELAAITRADLVDYLPRTTRRSTSDGTVWDPVLAELRDRPDSLASVNLATVLTTPLMVALARAIYSDVPGRDPAVLLEFSTPEAIEDHLLGTFIPTMYRHQPDRRGWDPHRAHRWLRYLAVHLHGLGKPDLAWWELGSTMPRSSRTLLVGIVTGLLVGLIDWFAVAFRDAHVAGLANSLVFGVVDGFAVALALGCTFAIAHRVMSNLRGPAFEPSRVRLRVRRPRPPLVSQIGLAFVGGFMFGLAYTAVVGLINWFVFASPRWLEYALVTGLATGLVFGVAVGLVFGLMAGLEAPLDVATAASPAGLLRGNRRTVVGQLLAFGLVFGLVAALANSLAMGLAVGLTAIPLWWGMVVGLMGGLAYGLGLTAWGQWVLFARIWLPLTGRLPWAVVAFLDDACRRGVLRQAGPVYQFRHARLQNHLTHLS
ncbi:helix-turn-helix domain-containing protein [Actinocrispum wychmicini]|uniref:NACHT domain-containing protein n=1 Tax=Actinocrispum wychmicini TaxID=1213861 RepID=A0A4R2J8Y0_9PSEU|nr:helix-turn-helix transcriptional regulator [Actinocrispum wychmicini]TCO52299.1 NACHT domain-containing protein [Actinocrispum wychmicini]